MLSSTLIAALREPAGLRQFDGREWTQVITQAREWNLLGALAIRCADARVAAPPQVARHLDGALQLAQRQRQSVVWETFELQRVLGGLGVPIVLLKGAAYVMSPDALGIGRTFGDIDILVPRDSLGDVESCLMLAGWVGAKTDPYDQRYYRQWMHELPPMMHIHRGTVLDVHHTILPLTARNAPDPRRLLDRSRPLTGLPSMRLLAPEDLLAHSLTHLMHEGELHNGMRDLLDVDEMVRNFEIEPGFWRSFLTATSENDLAWPVGLGLHLARRLYETPVPAGVVDALLGRRPPGWLEPIYRRALGVTPSLRAPAELLVYVRAHALRMPMRLLLRHLTIKGWRRMWPEREGARDRIDEPTG